MKKYLLLHLIFLLSQLSYGQISINDFLKSYRDEESVIFQKNKFYKLNTLSYQMPFIEKLEVRTETNEFDFRKQEYLVRVSPNSLKNIKTQRQFQETIRYMNEKELDVAKNEAIRKRYELIVDDIFLEKILTIKKKQATLLKDKVTLLQRSISLDDFDVIELIDAEDNLQKNSREIIDLKNAILTTKNTIQRNFPNAKKIKIKVEKTISVQDVKTLLSKIDSISHFHPQLEVQSAKVYNKILEHQWEMAKTKFSLGYLQAKYGYDPNDNFQKSFSLGVGFDIPFKNAGRLELNELEIDVRESESEFRNLRNTISEGKYFRLQKLENLIRKYELVDLQLNEGQAEYALKEYQKIAETPPKALVRLRENTLKIEMLLQELEYEIMQTFVEYLDYSGLLVQMPLKNYLLKE
jgi:hypothetical protein